MRSKTNWPKLKSLSEKEILKAAKTDIDAKPLTSRQLKKFKRVHTPKIVDVKSIRTGLQLSQEEFAKYFGVSIRTIQEWEQHRRNPTATARNFLLVIAQNPKAVQKALFHN